MFGNLGELAGLMKKAGEMKQNLAKMKAEIAECEFYGTCPDNKVSVVLSGDFRLRQVKIAPEAGADLELLEDLVKTAVNSAVSAAQINIQEKMKEVTGGINLPGLF
ncbi:MAG: YbaB/EbfC family nucleoid-associated protein [Victivallaceae bacterium]|nr:YbaB/EbfC family nucleoid-associated protein [Victivallaceae bacterium]